MSIKEKILQELEQLPDSSLQEVLEFISSLHPKVQSDDSLDQEVWQAYLKSEKEREEVYRRLANS